MDQNMQNDVWLNNPESGSTLSTSVLMLILSSLDKFLQDAHYFLKAVDNFEIEYKICQFWGRRCNTPLSDSAASIFSEQSLIKCWNALMFSLHL